MIKEIVYSNGLKFSPVHDVGDVVLLKKHRYIKDEILKRRAMRIVGYSFNADINGEFWCEYVGECLCTYDLICFLDDDIDFVIRG